jgi:selenide,water dikinase
MAVQRRAAVALRCLSVNLVAGRCQTLEAGALLLANGSRLPADCCVLALGTRAPVWPAGSGLATDAEGFIATGPSLQSLSHPEVFAAGDVAARPDAPHPKSGVYAVRAGPPLLHNLQAYVQGTGLRRYVPQRRTLNLISCGGRQAIVSWGPWSAGGVGCGVGTWAWRWKDRIDRAFVRRFTDPAAATSPSVSPGDGS